MLTDLSAHAQRNESPVLSRSSYVDGEYSSMGTDGAHRFYARLAKMLFEVNSNLPRQRLDHGC
jgi:hypothetical protein